MRLRFKLRHLLMCGDVVTLHMTGRTLTASSPAGYDSVDGDRAGSNHGSVRPEREHKRLRFGVADDSSAIVLEVEPVAFLVRRKIGAVHEYAAVDKVQPPVTCAFKYTGHDGPGRRSRLAARRKHLREHLT